MTRLEALRAILALPSDAADDQKIYPARTSYDDKQMTAALTACTACGRSFYMTKPAPVCIACRRAM